jgi:hypothetical protein
VNDRFCKRVIYFGDWTKRHYKWDFLASDPIQVMHVFVLVLLVPFWDAGEYNQQQ